MLWTCFEVTFSEKKCPVHPGMSKIGTTSRNWKNFHIFKLPKNVPKSNQTCFEHVSRNFFGKIVARCTLEVREKRRWKIWKISNFLKCPKRFLIASKQVLNLFWGIFFEKKWLVHTGGSRLEKIKKKSKKIQIFRNVQKRTQQSSNMLRGDFLWNHHALQGQKMEKNEKKSDFWNFNVSKNVPKSVQTRFELVLR